MEIAVKHCINLLFSDSILPAEYVSVLVSDGEMVRDLIKYAAGFVHSIGKCKV